MTKSKEDINKSVIFFSDVHLSISRPAQTRQLLDFFASDEFRNTPTVYILGDLFDLWIGPQHLERIDYKEVIAALKERTNTGQAIYFIYGNRDFLVDKTFAKATGIKVLEDEAEIILDGKKIWLTHGDLLCTFDKGYHSYRRLVRSKLIKSAYQNIPPKARYGIGQGLREISSRLVSRKTEVERTIVSKTVESVFRKGYDMIICGHIHKPQQREYPQGKRLFTLGAFSPDGYYLVYQDGDFLPQRH